MSYLSTQSAEAMRRAKVFATGVVTTAEIDGPAISVDVELRPDGVEVTVEYAPVAGALFRVPQAGDLVLCAFPDGDMTDGHAIAHVPAGGQNSVPEGLSPGEVLIWAPEGENVRVVAAGGGTVTVEAGTVVVQSDDIQLGGNADKVVTQARLDLQFAEFLAHYSTHQHLYLPTGAPSPVPTTGPQVNVPDLGGSSTDNVKTE